MKGKLTFKEFLILTMGMFIVSAGVYYIMMPSNIVVGTLSGLVIVLANFIPLKISTLTLILNVLLLVVGFLLIGSEFGIKTVIASFMLPMFLRLFEIVTPDLKPLTDDLFVNVLCFIIVISAGQSMLFNINASSGGIDVVSKLLNKFLHMELGQAQCLIGFLIAGTSIFVYDRNILVVSLLGTYLSGIVLDHFIDGAHIRKRVCIISPQYPEIQEFIVKELHRGATLYKTQGGWDYSEKMELVTILQKNEYAKLLDFVHQKDPNAFVTVSTVAKVIGKWNPHSRTRRI